MKDNERVQEDKKILRAEIDAWLLACENYADIQIPDKKQICTFLTLEMFDKIQTAKQEVANEILAELQMKLSKTFLSCPFDRVENNKMVETKLQPVLDELRKKWGISE